MNHIFSFLRKTNVRLAALAILVLALSACTFTIPGTDTVISLGEREQVAAEVGGEVAPAESEESAEDTCGKPAHEFDVDEAENIGPWEYPAVVELWFGEGAGPDGNDQIALFVENGQMIRATATEHKGGAVWPYRDCTEAQTLARARYSSFPLYRYNVDDGLIRVDNTEAANPDGSNPENAELDARDPVTTTLKVETGPDMGGSEVVITNSQTNDEVCVAINDYQLVDLTELSSSSGTYIHVEYGMDGVEYETLLNPGRYSIMKPFTSGHVWELGPDCTPEQALRKHVQPNHLRRVERLVNNDGYVHYEELIEAGMIEIVWQEQPIADIPTEFVADDTDLVNKANEAGDGEQGEPTHVSDLLPGQSFGPYEGVVVLQPWADAGVIDGHKQITLVVPEGETIEDPSWQGGAVWSFPGWTLEEVIAQEQAKTDSYPLYTVKDGKIVPVK